MPDERGRLHTGTLAAPLKRTIVLALVGGVLVALLKFIEYQHVVRVYPAELYGGAIALVFTALGLYAGLRWRRNRETVLIREIPVSAQVPFEADVAAMERIALTPRELEILALIAEGLSNREIGEKLFVSENTVKTHSSRLFAKLGVSRRVQAVKRAKDLRIIP